MILKRLGAFCFAILLSQQCAQAEPKTDTTPYFLPMGESTDQFQGDHNADFSLHYQLQSPSANDEGLLTGARVRDYLLGRPNFPFVRTLDGVGRVLPFAVKFIDNYGLYDLSKLAEDKALELSTMPMACMQNQMDGIIDTARYYNQMGRRDLSDKIFANLIAGAKMPLAPEYTPDMIYPAYTFYLRETDDKAKLQSAPELVKKITKSLELYGHTPYENRPPMQAPFNDDWKPTASAYKLIETGDYENAKIAIDALMSKEKLQATHTPARISRLIQLAKAYARKQKLSESRELLEQILPLTEADMLANTRLYVSAELITLPGISNAAAKKYRDYLYKVAERINELAKTNTGYQNVPGDSKERSVYLLDSLALAYSFNDEAAKSYKILKAALARYSPSPYASNVVHAHLAYFAAKDRRFSSIRPAIEKDIAEAQELNSSFNFVLAQTLDACITQGRPNYAEALAEHVINVRTKRFLSTSQRLQPCETTSQPPLTQADREWRLNADLDAARFALGEIQNKNNKFEQAENNLKLVEKSQDNFLNFRRERWVVDLGKALDGQKKYSEELVVYKNQEDRIIESPLPILWEVIRLVKNKHIVLPEEQMKVINIVNAASGSIHANRLLEPTEVLLDLCKQQAWPEPVLQRITELRDFYYQTEGKAN